jgi:glycosyltransferase involved in cell wall biosynthesis
MSSLTQNQIGSEPALTPAGQSTDAPTSASFPGVLFFMINSLETGGSERQFVELVSALNRSGRAPHLGCIQRIGALLDGGGLDGLGELHQFGLGGSLYGWESIRSRWRLMRYLRKAEIAVAHAFDFYANLTMIPAAKLAGVPVVIGSQRQLGDLLTAAQFRVQLEMFRWCDKVVCNSQAAADRLRQEGLPESKLAVIRNGLPPSAFAETRATLPRVPDLLRVGMIARMNHRVKNHSLFLRAAARVASRVSGVEFVLVGDGPLRAELEQQVKDLGLLNRVHFLGDRRDIPSILGSLDITVLPSASESMSNSIIESMAAGIPVIANRVGGNKELITDDRGVLVTADDEQALSAAMEGVLRDHALRIRLGQNARTYAQANFTIEQMRKQHEELYVSLIERKRGRAATRGRAPIASRHSML